LPESRKKVVRYVKKKDLRVWLLYFIFSISLIPTLVCLFAPYFMINVDFFIYNDSPYGCSKFKGYLKDLGYEVRPMYSTLDILSDMDEGYVLLIIGPSKQYNPTDTLSLFQFIMRGGSVLIADDFGSANSLFLPMTYLGLQIRFGPGILIDVGSSYNNRPTLPVITRFQSHPITQGVRGIVLNYATFINATLPPLAVSSDMSWNDIDGDFTPDPENETAGPFIVATAIDFGEFYPNAGKIVMVSDPSIFTNMMIDYLDNRKFVLNIVNWLSDYGFKKKLIFDEGHLMWPVYSSNFYFGLIMSQITFFTTNWYIAPLFPIISLYFLRRWAPRPMREIPLYPITVYKKRGESKLYSQIIRYKSTEAYGHLLKILHRKWMREAKRILKMYNEPDIGYVLRKARELGIKIDEKVEKKVLDIVSKEFSVKINKLDFSEIYFFMEGILEDLKTFVRKKY